MCGQSQVLSAAPSAAWIRATTAMLTPFMPAEVRLFSLSDVTTATDWIGGARRKGA